MQYATEPKCNYCDACMNEYCGCKLGRIKEMDPTCDSTAVIPSITVDSVEGITNLANCLVHVTSTNTTYYVDDKHRIMITWTGLMTVHDYNFESNPLNLRNQIAYDSGNNIAAIFDNNGNYYMFQLTQVDNNYNLLNNKPMLNGVVLQGDLTLDMVGISSITNSEIDSLIL